MKNNSHGRIRAVLIVAASLAATSPAFADVNYLPFSNAPSAARDVALSALQKESTAAIQPGDVHVAKVDLDGDGTAEIIAYAFTGTFCSAKGCEPRVLRKSASQWTDILAEPDVRTHGIGRFSVIGEKHNGFSDLLVGSLYLVHDGAGYREDVGPVRTELDTTAFDAVCLASPDTARDVRDAGARADIKEPANAFCGCIANQFETAGLQQGDLDGFTSVLGGQSIDKAAAMSSRPADYAATVADFRFSCGIKLSTD